MEEEEEEEAPATSLRFMMQNVKQWMMSVGKPQQRRRARSKYYRMWTNRIFGAIMVAMVISAITTLIATGTARNDSSCRHVNDAVRRVCKDTFGADCRSLATKVRSLCYITERCDGIYGYVYVSVYMCSMPRYLSVHFHAALTSAGYQHSPHTQKIRKL